MSSIHISKRDGMPFAKALMIRLIGVLLSLVVCAVVIVALTKLNPVEVYKAIFSGAVGTSRRAWVTIRDALILLCVAIGLTPAFKMRFWNIGAEGQVLMGGCVSAAIMIYGADHFGTAQLIPMMVVGSIVAGMIWGLIPAFFKAHWNTNETLFTLMMNYVAMQIITFCIVFWENPGRFQHRRHHQLQDKARLAPGTLRTDLRLDRRDRPRAYRCHVRLLKVQQTGLRDLGCRRE